MSATDRRRDLRDRLTAIAEARIAAQGLAALRARDLAAEAGCALGAIYTAVGDLGELVLAVNARTFARLGAEAGAALARAPDDPAGRLIAMAQFYHRFAAGNRHLWRALFDLDRPEGTTAPDWYRAEMERLLALIEGPVAALAPDLPPQDRALLARALFSSVHGIVLLGLDRAQSGVPEAEIDRMLALTLSRLTQRGVS